MKKTITFLCVILALVAAIIIFSTGIWKNTDNELRVYCYGDYMDPDLLDQFEEETGIKVILDTFDTSEEMYPVIKNGSGVYDVICPSDYMIEKLINEGLLAKINYNNIPNIKNIDETYLKIISDSFDPGNKYSVPYQWGTLGIMYNSKAVDGSSITSWNDLWNKEYKDTIIMPNSLRDTLAVALKAHNYSLNTLKEKELSTAVDYLIKQQDLIYKYTNDSARDFLVGEAANVGVVWNGELLYSQELNPDMDFVIPSEGTELFFDNWCIPANATHVSNAEKWIDFMCRPDVAYTNFEYLTYSTPNKAARELMDDDLKNNENLFPSKELLSKCEILRDLGPDGDDLYSKYWKLFKSN